MESFEQFISTSWWLGIPAGFFFGLLLAMNPLALPMLGTAVAIGSVGEVASKGAGVRMTGAFAAGMVLPYTALGFVAGRLDEITNNLLRPYLGIGYLVLALALLGLGGFLLVRPAKFCLACAQPGQRSPTLLAAFFAGIPGGFVNCPACAALLLGVAGAAATLGNPLYSGAVMFALGIGHGAMLTALVWFIVGKRMFPERLLAAFRPAAAIVMIGVSVYFFWLTTINGLQPGPRLP